jgi:hypothetical protein
VTAAPPAGRRWRASGCCGPARGAGAGAGAGRAGAARGSGAGELGARVAHAEAWTALAAWSEAATPGRWAAREAAAAADLVSCRCGRSDGPRAELRGARGGAAAGRAGRGSGGAVAGGERAGDRGAAAGGRGAGGRGGGVLAARSTRGRCWWRSATRAPRMAATTVTRGRSRELAPGVTSSCGRTRGCGRGEPVLHVERALPSGAGSEGGGSGAAARVDARRRGCGARPWGGAGAGAAGASGDLCAALALGVGGRRWARRCCRGWGRASGAVGAAAGAGGAAVGGGAGVPRAAGRGAAAGAGGEGDGLAVAGRMAGLVDHELWDIERCGRGGRVGRWGGVAAAATGLGDDGRRGAASSGLVVEAPHAARSRAPGAWRPSCGLAARQDADARRRRRRCSGRTRRCRRCIRRRCRRGRVAGAAGPRAAGAAAAAGRRGGDRARSAGARSAAVAAWP